MYYLNSSSILQSTGATDYDDQSDEQSSNNAENFDFTMDESTIIPKIEVAGGINQEADDPLDENIQKQQINKEKHNNTNSIQVEVEVHEEELFCDWIRTNLSTIRDPLLRMPLYCNIVKEIQNYMQNLRDNGKI